MPEAIQLRSYQERLDRLTDLLESMIRNAAVQATRRCPYRNRLDNCTAQFGCRNQRRPGSLDASRICGGDEQLDYRGVWGAD